MSGRISALRRPERGRQDDPLRGQPRAAACGGRSTAEPPSSRCSTRTRCSRSAPITHRPEPNPSTVWVGTGESWTRNSVSVGDGIYRSTDGGETWTNMGLAESERISRIVVDPGNGDVVYACVPGQALERQRRARRLQDDRRREELDARAEGRQPVDRLLRPGDGPEGPAACCFAGLWDFRRKGWTFRSGGDGPDAPSGSGLFRTERRRQDLDAARRLQQQRAAAKHPGAGSR